MVKKSIFVILSLFLMTSFNKTYFNFSVPLNNIRNANEVKTYNLVSSVDELVDGVKVIIVGEKSSAFYTMSATQNSNNRGQISTSIVNDIATPSSGYGEFLIGKGVKNNDFYYTFSDTNGYLYAASSSKNYLRSKTTFDENCKWKVELSDGNFNITAQGNYTHNVMQYNSSSSLFSCYTSASQKPVKLYIEKRTEGTRSKLADAINIANDNGNGCYTKTSEIGLEDTYPDTYPWNEKNPLNTQYTKDGLYMVERQSGYYTKDNTIWHYSKNSEGVETRSLSMSNYTHFYDYYKTLRDFDGTYVNTKFSETPKAKTNGYVYTSVDGAFADLDKIELIYFAAPLVKINDGSTFLSFSAELSLNIVDETFVLNTFTVMAKLSVSDVDYNLKAIAKFSNIGSTILDYTI